MPESSHRVSVDGVDWHSLIPALHLFRAFRMAIGPAKLFLAMFMVVMTYLGGLALDSIWGPQVYRDEVAAYLESHPQDYDLWLSRMEEQTHEDYLKGIFETTLDEELRAFRQLLASAMSLDLGVHGFLLEDPTGAGGVLGALATMTIGIPGWLYHTHPGFLAVFLLYAFVLTVTFGGSISRLAALQATRDIRATPFDALRFNGQYFTWFILAPIIPLAIALGIGFLIALLGLLFYLPLTDILGSLGFGLLLVGGFIIAVLLIGFAGASNLLFPALAVEGTDGFDANSRSFSYVFGQPWRYVFYSLLALIYGAITYTFVGFVIYLALWATKTAVTLVPETLGGYRFDAILPDPQLDQLPFHSSAQITTEDRGWSVDASTAIVTVWVKLLIGLLPAFAFSYYFCAQTWIYLLLRQSRDGTDLEEIYLDGADEAAASEISVPDKVEPDETS